MPIELYFIDIGSCRVGNAELGALAENPNVSVLLM